MFTAIAAFYLFFFSHQQNQMSYDTQQFYNGAAAAVAGLGSAALFFFRFCLPLLPPGIAGPSASHLSPFTGSPAPPLDGHNSPVIGGPGEGRVYSRLSVPAGRGRAASQRSHLLAALSVGSVHNSVSAR